MSVMQSQTFQNKAQIQTEAKLRTLIAEQLNSDLFWETRTWTQKTKSLNSILQRWIEFWTYPKLDENYLNSA